MIWTKAWWRGAGERAIKTWAQTWMAVMTVQVVDVVTPEMALNLPWATASVTASLAVLYSLFTSIGNAEFTAGEPAARRAAT